MRRILLVCLLLWAQLCMPVSAQGHDPFAILFGDPAERLDAGQKRQPGRDDIEIVSLKLNNFTLIETQTAFRISTELCLPIAPIFEALEIPVEIDADVASGWFKSKDRVFELDFVDKTATRASNAFAIEAQNTEEGWCLSLDSWSSVLPVRFDYKQTTLTVTLTPEEILPIEARLEREAMRAILKSRKALTGPEYPVLKDPYRWLSLPTADISLTSKFAQTGEAEAGYAIDIAGDFLKMSGRMQLRPNIRPRITLGRLSQDPDQLGPAKARQFSLGDVVATPLPLLSKGGVGQGFNLSNRPITTANIFDTTEIRGPLPIGWEAELYDGDQLLAFTTEPDIAGDYVFPDVPLQPGYNRFTVKLFGPFGETDSRDVKIIVGAELCPENEIQYSVGLVKPESQNEDLIRVDKPASAYASLRYGLTKRITTQLDTVITPEAGTMGATASLSGSAFDVYGVARLATQGEGRPAAALSLLKRIEPLKARVKLEAQDFGDLETEITGIGDQRIQKALQLGIDTSLNLGLGPSPNTIRSRMAWKSLVDGSAQTQISSSISGSLAGARWAKSVQFAQQEDAAGQQSTSLNGGILVSQSLKDIRLRGALTYSAQDRFELQTLSIAAQKRFGRKGFGQVGITHDMTSSAVSVNASLSKVYDNFVLSANANANDQGEITAGINLSFALYNDRLKGRYSMALPGLSRTGGIRATVFDDLDEDGVFTAADAPVEDAGFIIAQSLRTEQTNAQGVAIYNELQPGAKANVELKVSSLADPFLRPARVGVAVTPRAGRITEVAVPLTATADVDGFVSLIVNDHKTPVSGVTIEAVDVAGNILTTTKTEYDGYFYLDGVPAKPLTLRVTEADLSIAKATMQPVSVNLSRNDPSRMGLELSIFKQ